MANDVGQAVPVLTGEILWTPAELRDRLGWASPVARAWALTRLTERRLKIEAELLRHLLKDEDREVSLQAIRYAETLGVVGCVPALIELWEGSPDVLLRANAVGALGKIDRAAAISASSRRAGAVFHDMEISHLGLIVFQAITDGDLGVPPTLLDASARRMLATVCHGVTAVVGSDVADPFVSQLLTGDEIKAPGELREVDVGTLAGRIEMWRKERAAPLASAASKLLADRAVEVALRAARLERALRGRGGFKSWWPDVFSVVGQVVLGCRDDAKSAAGARSFEDRFQILVTPWAILPDDVADDLIGDADASKVIRLMGEQDLQHGSGSLNVARWLSRRPGTEAQVAAARIGLLDWDRYPVPSAAALEGIASGFGRLSELDRVYALHLLRAVGHPAALRLAEANYESLIRSDEHAEFVGFLGELARPELFRRLSEEWAPGEPALADALVTIAEVSGLASPDAWRREADELEAMIRRFEPGVPEPCEELVTSLRCTVCGRSYRYVFDFIIVAGKDDVERDLRLPRIVLCKKCGAMDRWEMSPGARAGLLAQALGAGRAPRVRAGKLMLRALGRPKEIRSFGEAIRACEAELEHRGEDPDLLLEIGNLYRHGGLPDRAVSCYERALAAKPGHPGARSALEFVRAGDVGLEASDIDLLAAEGNQAPSSREKAGRNDPCPCGSGRKHKRCCLPQ